MIPITRAEIIAAIEAATPPGDFQRVHDIGAKCGQLFGWIAGPDQQFLCDWLPAAAEAYPRSPMRIVEIGTYGGSTARGLVVLSRGGLVTSIDNFQDMNEGSLNGHPDGTSYWTNTIRNNGPDLSEYARLIVGDSGEVGRAWTEEIDLTLVDGAHDRDSALRDLSLFATRVVPGGYCLVDDFDMPAVKHACDDFFDGGWTLVRRPYEGPPPGHGYTGGKILAMQRKAR